MLWKQSNKILRPIVSIEFRKQYTLLLSMQFNWQNKIRVFNRKKKIIIQYITYAMNTLRCQRHKNLKRLVCHSKKLDIIKDMNLKERNH